MYLTKIFSIIIYLFKIINLFITRKKGQVNFANIPLDYVIIEAQTDQNQIDKIIIRNINKVNFNEIYKTVTFVNNLGTFTFNVDTIQSMTLFDSVIYKQI